MALYKTAKLAANTFIINHILPFIKNKPVYFHKLFDTNEQQKLFVNILLYDFKVYTVLEKIDLFGADETFLRFCFEISDHLYFNVKSVHQLLPNLILGDSKSFLDLFKNYLNKINTNDHFISMIISYVSILQLPELLNKENLKLCINILLDLIDNIKELIILENQYHNNTLSHPLSDLKQMYELNKKLFENKQHLKYSYKDFKQKILSIKTLPVLKSKNLTDLQTLINDHFDPILAIKINNLLITHVK